MGRGFHLRSYNPHSIKKQPSNFSGYESGMGKRERKLSTLVRYLQQYFFNILTTGSIRYGMVSHRTRHHHWGSLLFLPVCV